MKPFTVVNLALLAAGLCAAAVVRNIPISVGHPPASGDFTDPAERPVDATNSAANADQSP